MAPKRKLPPGNIGPMQSRVPRVALDGELGWLTPLRPAACGYHVFRCRCGVEVSKLARYVKRQAEGGATPKCSPTCPHQAAEAVA